MTRPGVAPSAASRAASSSVAPGQLVTKGPEPASTRIVRPWPRRSTALTGVRTVPERTPSGAKSAAFIGRIPTSSSDTVQPFASKSPTLHATIGA